MNYGKLFTLLMLEGSKCENLVIKLKSMPNAITTPRI